MNTPARPVDDARHAVANVLPLRRYRSLDRTQFEAQRDHPLLGAVVQIALEAAAGLVSCGDDAGTRRGELRAGLRVGDRGGDEVGEIPDPRLGFRRQRFGLR